jgi:hypothetical protein
MSANLDLVRSIYADWERGDFRRTDWADPDIELVWPDGPSPGTWSSLSGVQAGWRDFLDAWDDYRVRPEDYLIPDVDFAKRLIHVRRSYVQRDEGPPKSGRVRSVPMTDQIARAIDELSRREWATRDEDLVFCNELARHFGDSALRRRFCAARDLAGIKPIRFHDLRHTFGTLSVQVFPLSDVKAYMGHGDIATAMIYLRHVPQLDAAQSSRGRLPALCHRMLPWHALLLPRVRGENERPDAIALRSGPVWPQDLPLNENGRSISSDWSVDRRGDRSRGGGDESAGQAKQKIRRRTERLCIRGARAVCQSNRRCGRSGAPGWTRSILSRYCGSCTRAHSDRRCRCCCTRLSASVERSGHRAGTERGESRAAGQGPAPNQRATGRAWRLRGGRVAGRGHAPGRPRPRGKLPSGDRPRCPRRDAMDRRGRRRGPIRGAQPRSAHILARGGARPILRAWHLRAMKRAAGRARDLDDLEQLPELKAELTLGRPGLPYRFSSEHQRGWGASFPPEQKPAIRRDSQARAPIRYRRPHGCAQSRR